MPHSVYLFSMTVQFCKLGQIIACKMQHPISFPKCVPVAKIYCALWDCINTLRPRQNGRRFADDIFKRIFLNENVRISIKISLKFVPKGPINNNPALVQIMDWRRSGDNPLSEPMMVRLPTHICVTRPQWVKSGVFLIIDCYIVYFVSLWWIAFYSFRERDNFSSIRPGIKPVLGCKLSMQTLHSYMHQCTCMALLCMAVLLWQYLQFFSL